MNKKYAINILMKVIIGFFNMFTNVLTNYFADLGVALGKSFIRYTNGVIQACSFSTHEIARHVSKSTGKDFNTSEKGLSYLLNNDKFQIDDSYWRRHINMVFDLMREQGLIKTGDVAYIQVDFTTHEDYFLILTASIIIGDRSVPLYFTIRNYPKKKNQYDHKFMEQAFIKGLKHVLSKKFTYVIVADRGFGNDRFMTVCEDNGFQYLIRAMVNLRLDHKGDIGMMDKVCKDDGVYDVKIMSWKKEKTLYRCSNDKGEWYLFSSIQGIDQLKARAIYKDRFKIEKCFQDLKSSGFDIEKTKIRKYSNYKRLLAMAMVAHVLMVMLGHVIMHKLPSFLKNSTLMASVILAFFQSDERLCHYFQKKN